MECSTNSNPISRCVDQVGWKHWNFQVEFRCVPKEFQVALPKTLFRTVALRLQFGMETYVIDFQFEMSGLDTNFMEFFEFTDDFEVSLVRKEL